MSKENKTLDNQQNGNDFIANLSSCFCVVDEETGHYESIHKTLESAEKEIANWKKFKPSKDVSIVEREFH